MTEDAVVERLCNLPVDFRGGTLSAVALVERSGYLEKPTVLTRESVLDVLRKDPSLIDAWLGWSEDQRTSPAWMIGERADSYFVKLWPGGEEILFADRYEACAEFVTRQIQSIARFAKKNSN